MAKSNWSTWNIGFQYLNETVNTPEHTAKFTVRARSQYEAEQKAAPLMRDRGVLWHVYPATETGPVTATPMWLVMSEGEVYAAYPRENMAKVYASGFSKPTTIIPGTFMPTNVTIPQNVTLVDQKE